MKNKEYHFDCELYSSYLITIINEGKTVEHQFLYGKVRKDYKQRFEKDRRIFTSMVEKTITTSDDLTFVCTLNTIYKVDSVEEITIPIGYVGVFKYLVIYNNASPIQLVNDINEFEYKTH